MLRFLLCLGFVSVVIGLQSQVHNRWLYWLFTLPGIALHEGAHFIAAFLMFGDPSGFSIFPSFDDRGSMVSLGHVQFVNDAFNSATVSLAPYLLILPSVWYLLIAADSKNVLKSLLFSYVAACGFTSLHPSPQDWSIAIGHPMSFLVAVPIFLTIIWLYWMVIAARLSKLSKSVL